MALIGNQLSSAENNSYRVLDNLASFTLTFDGSSSANVLASTDTIALSQHPFVTGQRVTYSSGGGSPIGGLLSGTAYYITKTDQNSFKLAISYVNAITNINIDLVGPGTGVTHSFNVAFDGINTKFKATYSNGTKCTISRAPQLDIAINGVVQQPYDSNPPPNGFTIEADATIVFSIAPLSGYTFWGKALSGSTASFETSDNSIDNFTGDGSTTNFTLSKTPANSQNVLVTISGVTQYPSDATGTRSYSTNANVLVFTAAPANASLIQVRYIGFAGPTSSNVTGFYGRTGNVVLNSSDGIGVGTAKIGTGIVGLATALLVEGNVRITGILTIGTSSITLNGSTDTISARTVSTGSTVSIGASTIVVGNNFIGNNSIGLGQTSTIGRNAGINTVAGTLIYNSSTGTVQFYNGNRWVATSEGYIEATGGTISDYIENNTIYRAHIFGSSGTLSVTAAPSGASVEYLVVAGGGGAGEGGGGAGGFRTGTGVPVSAIPGSYSVTVGAGGLFNQPQGFNGNPSVFGPITSTAGGGGGGTGAAGQPGGSGGGGRRDGGNAAGSGNTPPVSPPQGNPGGAASAGSWIGGGGGGGSGGAGTAGTGAIPAVPGSETGGNGGPGTTSTFSGTSTIYAGGGGGGVEGAGPAAGGQPGPGGGGLGAINAAPNTRIATSGTYATGGGGGGRAVQSAPPSPGGNGGSGIVVVRYVIGGLAETAKASGGAISYAGGKTIHQFLSSGTFTITNPSLTSVDYLVVAGGGGGGSGTPATAGHGGGGAGGVRNGSGLSVNSSPGIFTIQVGSGGAYGTYPNGYIAGFSGGPSFISNPGITSITAVGGGGGGAGTPGAQLAGNGGSGGGGGFNQPGGFGIGPGTPAPVLSALGVPTPLAQTQGRDGGSGIGNTPAFAAGGGGGVGGSGSPAPAANIGGAGGPGNPYAISGSSVTYAGGGGGGGGFVPTSNTGGAGGPGGGGAGGSIPSPTGGSGTSGTINLGGGGGGGAGINGGSGGSGIVIIAYPS